MRNSTFRKNRQVLDFVLQSLSTVGTAATWEKQQLRSATVPTNSLWSFVKTALCSALKPSSLSPPLPHYCFFVKSLIKFLNRNSIQIYSRGEKIMMHLGEDAS